MRWILHLDIDAFYAQVEQKHNPLLRGKPVIVGGNSLRRSVVATASYEARPYGVKSGMPLFQAIKLCPDCIVVKPNFQLYEKYAMKFFELLYKYSPDVEIASQDEAYLELTRCSLIYPDMVKAAKKIKEEIQQELGLSISAGLASSRFVAKLATSRAKPGGFHYVPHGSEKDFVAQFSLEDIPGVGPKVLKKLHSLGIWTVQDLRKCSIYFLRQHFGKRGEELLLLSYGIDFSELEKPAPAKSISRGYTLEKDIYTYQEALPHLLYLTDRALSDMREAGATTSRVEVRVRWFDFQETVEGRSFYPPSDDLLFIFSVARQLLADIMERVRKPARLLAVTLSQLSYLPQPGLFDDKQRQLMSAIDRARRKFGYWSLVPARELLLDTREEKEFPVFKSTRGKFHTHLLRDLQR